MKNVYRGGSTGGACGATVSTALPLSTRHVSAAAAGGRGGVTSPLPTPPLMTKVARTNDLADFHWEIRAKHRAKPAPPLPPQGDYESFSSRVDFHCKR